MEIVECIRKNDWYIHVTDDGAYNAEREIALIKDSSSNFELAYPLGCTRLYFQVITYKLIYPVANYNDAWNYIKGVKGLIKTVETDFDAVMKDEKLGKALGNVRLNRIVFEIKTLTNGKDCNTCVC